MLQRTAEYALRIAVWLARHPGAAQTSHQIAEGTKIPSRYLYRVLQTLVGADLVRSQPGPGGGYALTTDPDGVSLLAVVSAVTPVARIRSCPLGFESHQELCPLHQHLDDAYASVESALAKVTVGEVVRAPTPFPALANAAR
jgi:Rrf2 family transcriptional regulator, nitric oxide-sensitive transcriptional repressor